MVMSAAQPFIDQDAWYEGSTISPVRTSNGHATKFGSAFTLDVAIQLLQIHSPVALGRVLGLPNPTDIYKWLSAKRAMSAFYMARLSYLLALKALRPDYWTPVRIQREVDWHTIHLHEYAIPMSPEFLQRVNRVSKRQDGVYPARAGVRLRESHPNRPLAPVG